jgi:6-phosphogluconolactonase
MAWRSQHNDDTSRTFVKPDDNPGVTGPHVAVPPREVAPGLLVCPDADVVARAAARLFVEWAWQAIASDERFCVALSGGKTPIGFLRALATPEYRAQVDWPRVYVFWTDERPVPPESEESNYGLARRELLIRVPIPGGNVHRMEGERADVGRAAQDYEDVLRKNIPRDARGFPRFHLVMLGLGADGHTASLFPGQRALRETSRWVSTPNVPKIGSRRMTLTVPVLNAAHKALFLVTGAEKSEALHQMLTKKLDPPLPAQLVKLPDGTRTILCDEAAASGVLEEIGRKGELKGLDDPASPAPRPKEPR